jgi:hypothetical protein
MAHLSKYIENINFIAWVFHPNIELEQWWSQFETEHPEEKRNIQLARKVLMNFRTTNNELTEVEKILLFSKVLKQIEEKQHLGKSSRVVISLLKYAAVALLFFSIGALLFYKPNQFNPQDYAQSLTEPIPGNSAKLIRANGEDITLTAEKSILQYQTNGKLVVNNDTINVNHSKPVLGSAMNQLIIPYGKTSEIRLPDQTKVFLNAGSRLVYPEKFTGAAREVMLVGEAFFEVQHDQNHPFIVLVGDLRIKVLGTRFNVSAYPADNVIETVLSEGKVTLEQNDAGFFDRATELMPSQMASFDRTTKATNIKTVDTDNYTLWTSGVLKFESADLNQILKRVERFYNIRFHFTDPLLGGLLISGKLELNHDREEICQRLAIAASVKISKNGDDLYEVIR